MERIIDYISVSTLGRGYAGRIIDQMKKKDSVVYILRNNAPEAVMLSMADYQKLLQDQKSRTFENKMIMSEELAGSLHQFADAAKIDGEREFYKKVISEKHVG